MASSNTVGLDETFDVLAHSHRRYVLYYLRTNGEGVALDTLAAMLANELEGPSATGTSDTTEHIEVTLRHTHLPKLADAGLITFDADTNSVELDGTGKHGHFIDEAARVDGYARAAAGD